MHSSISFSARVRLLARSVRFTFILLASLLFIRAARAQSDLWQDTAPGASSSASGNASTVAWVQPQVFRAVTLNHAVLQPLLGQAPAEASQPLALSPVSI